MTKFIVLIITLLLWVPLAALNGWALEILWGWFVAPTFTVATLTLGQCVGISLVVRFLTARYIHVDGGIEESISQLVFGIFLPLVAVGSGWVYLRVFF